ncbi:MAG: hypothetical protein AABO41_00230 [Acidobacteriota bacterium]
MRNLRMRRKSLILTILALSLTLTPAMSAQQRSAVSAPADSIQENRQAVPVEGKCQNYSEYLGGKADGFAAPLDATQLSPALQAYFTSHGVTPTGTTKPGQYDETGQDKWVGQSFFIKCCKVCRAELEIRVKNLGGMASNDALIVGQAPFTPSQNILASGHIWDSTRPAWAGGTTSPKTMTIPLSPAALNSYIFNSRECNVPIDILVQDDTAVDYIKLKIWTY